jgi:protein SCO1
MKFTRNRLLCIAIAVVAAAAAATTMHRAQNLQATESALMYDTLPFYTKSDLLPRWRGAGDRRIGSFSLRDQHNDLVSQHVFEHGPTVVNFFFTGCATVCPVSMELLNLTRKDLAGEAPAFLSISVTPLSDDPATLAAYARRIDLPDDWHLATGVPREVFALAQNDLLTDIATPGPDGQPPHTERALLVDTMGRIRGIYNANQAVDLMRLRYDLRRLRAENADIKQRPKA